MSAFSRICGCLLAVGFLWVSAAWCQNPVEELPRRVLVLHSYHAGFSWTDSIQKGIEGALDQQDIPVQLYVDYLDTKRQPDLSYRQQTLPQLYEEKLGRLKFDILIVSDNHAFDFAKAHHKTLFKGIPVVFCGVNNYQPSWTKGFPQFTGVAEYPSFQDTLKLLQGLHPKVSDVIVIGSLKGTTGQKNRQLLKAAEALVGGDLKLTYWDDLATRDLATRLAKLPETHSVLLTSVVRTPDAEVLDFPATARFVRENSPVPVYGLWDFFLGEGIVGGKLVSGADQGRIAAELAIQVLEGASPPQLPIIYSAANRYKFDFRELERFDLSLDQIPVGSELIHQPRAFYEISPNTARTVGGLLILLGLLSAALAVNVHRRQRSERAYREQSQFLHSLLDAIPNGIYYKDRQGKYLGCNMAMEKLLGLQRSEIVGKTVSEVYTPAEAKVYREADEDLYVGGETQVYENTLTSQDGTRHNCMFHKAVYRNAKGEISGLVGSVLDITDRMKAEQALQESERYNRMLFEQFPVGMIVHQRDTKLLDVNSAFASILGMTAEETIGRCLLDFAPPEELKQTQRLMEVGLSQGQYGPIEIHLVNRDGGQVPVHLSGMAFSRGEEYVMLSSVEDVSARLRANEALRQSEERFRTTFETSPDAISINRLKDGLYIEVNQGFSDLTGFQRNEVLGKTPVELGVWGDIARRTELLKELEEFGAVSNFETIYQLKDGETATVLISARVIEIGGEAMVLSVIKNIEELKRSEANVRQSEKKYRRIFEHIQDVYYESALDGRILEISPSVERNLGFSREALLGTSFNELYINLKERQKVVMTLQKDGFIRDYEIWLRDHEGVHRPCAISAILTEDDQSGQNKIVGSLRDITERKNAEEETRQLAYFDTLTGLPNRALFNDRLNQASAQSRRNGDLVGVLFLDLDRFKDVNDTRGHASGDLLLKLTAQRLKACVRQSDTVARLGGDEFVLLLNGVKQEQEVLLVAQKVLRMMAAPVDLEGQEVFTTTSIGVVLAPMDGQDVDMLMKHADMAMYAAKAEGRNTYKFFSKEMNRKAMERHAVEISLRRAIREEEFFLVYQPQIDLESGRLIGVEALLRWQDPHKGLIGPDAFIPVAEDTGLIRSIGEWVLLEACKQGQVWREQGYPSLKIGVNLSGHQFKQSDFLDMVELALQTSGLPPGHLELELTESVLMENARETIAILTDLKIRGVKLAVDDFGTGYSSLSYLKNFPIDRIKIDRSFVLDITTDPNDATIVETIIAMARSLGLRVLAEGVETQEQLEFLRSRQCNELQGYYIGKPMPADQLTELLKVGVNQDGICLYGEENRTELH